MHRPNFINQPSTYDDNKNLKVTTGSLNLNKKNENQI